MSQFPTAAEIYRMPDPEFMASYEDTYAKHLSFQGAAEHYKESGMGTIPVGLAVSSIVSLIPGFISLAAYGAFTGLSGPALTSSPAAWVFAGVVAGVSAIGLTSALRSDSAQTNDTAEASSQAMARLDVEVGNRPQLAELVANRRQQQEEKRKKELEMTRGNGIGPFAAGVAIGSFGRSFGR